MIQRLIIPGKLPGMNEIIDGSKTQIYHCRQKRQYKFSLDKDFFTRKIADLCIQQNLQPVPCARLKVIFKERTLRRDPDNIQAGIKFILDGLVKAGILADDRHKQIQGLIYEFAAKAPADEIEVLITTV